MCKKTNYKNKIENLIDLGIEKNLLPIKIERNCKGRDWLDYIKIERKCYTNLGKNICNISDKGLICLTYQDLVIIEMQIKLFYFSPIRFFKTSSSAGKHAVSVLIYCRWVTWSELSGKHLTIQYTLRVNESTCTVSRTVPKMLNK